MKDTKEQIMETAYTLFVQSGYKAVTMNEIVRQTGLSKGAFYHYFGSKEQLFMEVVNHVFFGDFSRDYMHMPEVSLKKFIDEELEMVSKRHDSLMGALPPDDRYTAINYYTLIFDALRLFPEFKTRFEAYKKQRRDAWVRMIAAAKKNKEIRSDVPDEELAQIFIYMNQGVGLSFITGNKLRQKYREIGSLWNHLYRMLKT